MGGHESNTGWKTFIVNEAAAEDIGHGVVRLPEPEMAELALFAGDPVEIVGTARAVARVVPCSPPADPGTIQMDGTIRENAGAGIDDFVKVRRVAAQPAETIVISPVDVTRPLPQAEEAGQLPLILKGLVVVAGTRLEVPIFGFGRQYFNIEGTAPSGAVIIHPETAFKVKPADVTGERAQRVSYEDIGGLGQELAKVREIIELPMRYPGLFARLGIEAPKGLLLVGPSGTGKTLIARAVASEVKAHFIHVNGPEIMQKFYGESEARLRQVFAEANANAPSVIFLDEIDAIAPRRTESIGNVEKRVVAQLLVLMDGLAIRGQVVVIGATNVPNLIDPALRRPGRFDREILINPPNATARREILAVHTRRLSLAPTVDLDAIAELTHGFVGADLEALVKEAGMLALRRILAEARASGADPARLDQVDVSVRGEDFLAAFRETEPSALREFLPEKSGIRLADVGGMRSAKEAIPPLIRLCLRPAVRERGEGTRVPRGFLFTGASGTGKTLFAKALAGEFELPLIAVYSSALFSRWIGESEKRLEEIFHRARQVAPCILLLDEIDTLAPIRRSTEDSGVTQRMVSQLLREIDKAREVGELIVIATTNRPDLVDPAVLRPGRFDVSTRFELPDQSERREVIALYTRGTALSSEELEILASQASGLTGAGIEGACRKAHLAALLRDPAGAGISTFPEFSSMIRDAVSEAQQGS